MCYELILSFCNCSRTCLDYHILCTSSMWRCVVSLGLSGDLSRLLYCFSEADSLNWFHNNTSVAVVRYQLKWFRLRPCNVHFGIAATFVRCNEFTHDDESLLVCILVAISILWWECLYSDRNLPMDFHFIFRCFLCASA